MSNEELLELVDSMNLEVYNLESDYFCIKGINGEASVIFYDKEPIIKIKNHLLQMGRDSLKMDLDRLLSISQHH